MLLDKFQYLLGNAWVGTDVTIIHFPVAQLFHLCILGWHDANNDLRRLAQVRTVERNRRNWPTPQSLQSFLFAERGTPKSPGELSTLPEAAGWGGARRVHPISEICWAPAA